jgi:hypothetical protein
VISGKVTNDAVPGTYPIVLTLIDTTGGAPSVPGQVNITLNPALSPNGPFNWTGAVGTPFSQTIQPTGGVAPYTVAFDPATPVPSWLSITSKTGAGVVSGNPDVACDSATFTADDASGDSGKFTCTTTAINFKVTVTDALGHTLTDSVPVVLKVEIPQLAVTGLAKVHQTAGTALTVPAGAVSGGYGGTGNITYTAKNLPCDSLGHCDTISSSGQITGTLSDFVNPGGSYNVSVTAIQTDPANSANTITATYSITIAMP